MSDLYKNFVNVSGHDNGNGKFKCDMQVLCEVVEKFIDEKNSFLTQAAHDINVAHEERVNKLDDKIEMVIDCVDKRQQNLMARNHEEDSKIIAIEDEIRKLRIDFVNAINNQKAETYTHIHIPEGHEFQSLGNGKTVISVPVEKPEPEPKPKIKWDLSEEAQNIIKNHDTNVPNKPTKSPMPDINFTARQNRWRMCPNCHVAMSEKDYDQYNKNINCHWCRKTTLNEFEKLKFIDGVVFHQHGPKEKTPTQEYDHYPQCFGSFDKGCYVLHCMRVNQCRRAVKENPKYTDGSGPGGDGILKDGVLMTIDEVLKELNKKES